MNIYTIIILATIIITAALDTIAEMLNLRAMSPVLPEEFRDVYAETEYARSQEYTRAKTRFGFVTAAFDLALLLVFWFAGGFNWLDLLVRSLGWHEIPTGLLYISLLALGMGLFSLPFRIYSTFVIERRFGFNRTTLRTFVLDILKGAALGAAIGLPVLALVLWIIQTQGLLAWLYSWLAVTAFRITMQYVAPTVFMPFFNKFTLLEEGPLRDCILAYAESMRFPLKDVYVVDGSRRSSKANAFFTGFGKNKRIALYDTLIGKHTAEEVTSVLAHEIGHYRRKHIVIGMLIGIAEMGVMFFLLSLFVSRPALAEAFFMQYVSVYAGLVFFALLYSPVSALLSLGVNALSRRHEFEADRYAVQTYRKPEVFVTALKKLTASNLSNVTPHPFHVWLNYSHPPLLKRIEQIRIVAEEKIRHRGKMKIGVRDVM